MRASLLSHVFRASKSVTPEQACSLAEFLALGDLETDYLVALVERARAGSVSLEREGARRTKLAIVCNCYWLWSSLDLSVWLRRLEA